jgi:hypothetical protein
MMTTEIDLTLSGDAFKAQFGTEERIEMLTQLLRDIAEHPLGTPFLPKVEALNIIMTPGEMEKALERLEDFQRPYVILNFQRHVILSERANSDGAYLVLQSRLSNAAEVMGYMSMALADARDALKPGRAKDGVNAALSRFRQWCNEALKGKDNA